MYEQFILIPFLSVEQLHRITQNRMAETVLKTKGFQQSQRPETDDNDGDDDDDDDYAED